MLIIKKDTILCHSQYLIISNKTRIMDKTFDHVYTLGICSLSISLYFPLTHRPSVSWYIRQQAAEYWLTCWSISVTSQPSHVSWYSVDMQLILHRHLASTSVTWLALVTEFYLLYSDITFIFSKPLKIFFRIPYGLGEGARRPLPFQRNSGQQYT